MPGAKKPKIRKRGRSSLDEHKREGKHLTPPFPAILGEKLTFASWMNEQLPEMLWATLIVAKIERKPALGFFGKSLIF